jgi:hypothetical protein
MHQTAGLSRGFSIANRICDVAGAGAVFVSDVLKGLLGASGSLYPGRGTHVLKGVSDKRKPSAVGDWSPPTQLVVYRAAGLLGARTSSSTGPALWRD